MSKVIWTLSENEKNEILELYEKRIALENLTNIIDIQNEDLYQKLIADYGKVMNLYQQWWNKTSQKYSWESGKNWAVNFETNEVTIV